MAMSKKRIEAKIFALEEASGWLHDQANGDSSSDIFLDESGEQYDDLKVSEAFALCKQLNAKIAKLKAKLAE